MKKDNSIRMAYVGYQRNANEDLELFVSINRDTYYFLRELLSFAAKETAFFSKISDAVHLYDTLSDAWEKAIEESELDDIDD